MKLIQVELSDEVAKGLDALVEAGWFRSEDEAVRMALLEFIRHNRLELLEQFQLEDIGWTLGQRRTDLAPNAERNLWQPLVESVNQFSDDFMEQREQPKT